MQVLDAFALTGRVAVVTGGNRGLGRAFATALGEAGASVAILARDTTRSDAAVRELTGQGIRAAAFFGDVARRPDVDRAVDEIATALGRVDILVNAIAPGYVNTEMAPVDRPEFRRYWVEDAPMQRYATPEEIAPSVVYLASDASAFMTGSVLVIDGGYTVF